MAESTDAWKDEYSRKATIIQLAVGFIANIGPLLTAITMGFPSDILGPLVESTTPGFHVTIEEGSWVASVSEISAPFGCLLGGPFVDYFGRRKGLQLVNVANIVGWLLITLVPSPFASLAPLIAGRLVAGFGSGLAICVAAAYTAEVATPRLRTILVSFAPVLMGIGVFLVYLYAFFIRNEWTTMSEICIGISIVSVLLNTFLPESPLWLLEKGKSEEALKSLISLRGVKSLKDVDQEFSHLVKSAKSKSVKTDWKTTLKNVMKPESYKPLLIMNFFFFFQQTSGVSVVVIYGVRFAKDCGIPNDAYTVALFIGIIRVISTFVTSWACNRFGRRVPALATGCGMICSLFALTAYVSLRRFYPETLPSTALIPAACILLYIFTSSIGFSSLPWSMIGEMYPTNVRGFCSGVTSCCAFVYMFLSIKFYPVMVPVVGNIAVFSFFSIAAFTGTIFLAIFLPETHGKTLPEIGAYFRGIKSQKNSDLETA